ncbi:helicase [Tanacetum coccineum]
MLDEYSLVAKAFRTTRDWYNTHNAIDFHLRLHSDRKIARQYNGLNVSEVAAIIINDFGDGLPIRDIVVNNKDEGPKRNSELHQSYMALQYPLLFPYGEDGFHEKIPYHNNTGTKKQSEDLATQSTCRLKNSKKAALTSAGAFINKDTAEPVDEQIVRSLIQMLDEYSSVAKAFRMARDWCNAHNTIDFHVRLHSDRKITRQCNAPIVYEVAAIIINDFGDGLPTRDIVDAMALCRAYGNPDLFITFTSNPKWPEIAKMLAYFPGQKAHDRPKVRAHIFKLKLTELLDALTKKHVFGQSEAVIYVIEFQKRGLPHAHILLWLEEHSKCKTPSEIDDIISAELLSPTDDTAAYKVVTKYMLHGPCRKDARYAACTNDGRCSKHFPKPFLAEIFLDEEGYPHYRRRDNKGKPSPSTCPPLLEAKLLLLEEVGVWRVKVYPS